MDSVCFLNNKGGVGKTTLACNVGSFCAKNYDLRVLIVDADPQCNATQLVLGEDAVTKIYSSMRSTKNSYSTLFEILRPLTLGESSINDPTNIPEASKNKFGVDLIPGHPQVALLEDRLSQAWLQLSGGDIGGARQTNWNSQLCRSIKDNYDLIIFDVGPSLGALNRSVLIGVDFFMTPMGCDIFSLLGASNISQWLDNWFGRYDRSIEACKTAGFSGELEEYGIASDTDEISRFIGYTVQQYITKTIGGVRRPTKSYEKIRKKIAPTVQTKLGKYLAPGIDAESIELPDVPHMFSLVPLAQNASCPIHGLTSAEGLAGAQAQQQESYVDFIGKLSGALLANIGYDV